VIHDTPILDTLGALQGVICLTILAWLALDSAYVESAWFRRTWAKTRIPFPHTSFSPYFKRRR
jgi:hypothetical protein